jgi:flagellar basal-body rod protein FlgG
MIQAFYSGVAGLQAHQTETDIIANNMANVNTTAYKKKQEDFSSLLSKSMMPPGEPNAATFLEGSGAAVDGVQTDMSGGAAQQTGNSTDYYINGSGFFTVQDSAGNKFYTRDGSFHVVSGQNGNYLGTVDGMTVLGANGNPAAVDAAGNITLPGITDFSNSPGLLSAGGNLYAASTFSGTATASTTKPSVGMLEASNVDLADQMTDLIAAQRGYQMNSTVVTTADDIENMVNSLGQ